MSKSALRILLVNDDGIEAPGLRHLWESLLGLAEVTIVAPVAERSSAGMGITSRKPLSLSQVSWDGNTSAWKVNGTPADCVKLALSAVMRAPPHLILSGINRGTNAGRNVLYSGTVGGVIEGVLRGIPGIALSCSSYQEPNYPIAQPLIPRLVRYVIDHPLSQGSFLNVNFPSEASPLRGIRLTRQGKSYWIDKIEERQHPNGDSYYWLGCSALQCVEDLDSDTHLLTQGYVTATPIYVEDLTHNETIAQRSETFSAFFANTS